MWYGEMGVENAMPHYLPNIAELNGRAFCYERGIEAGEVFSLSMLTTPQSIAV